MVPKRISSIRSSNQSTDFCLGPPFQPLSGGSSKRNSDFLFTSFEEKAKDPAKDKKSSVRGLSSFLFFYFSPGGLFHAGCRAVWEEWYGSFARVCSVMLVLRNASYASTSGHCLNIYAAAHLVLHFCNLSNICVHYILCIIYVYMHLARQKDGQAQGLRVARLGTGMQINRPSKRFS